MSQQKFDAALILSDLSKSKSKAEVVKDWDASAQKKQIRVNDIELSTILESNPTSDNLIKLFKSKILHKMENEEQKEIAAQFLLNSFGKDGLLWPATVPSAKFVSEMGTIQTCVQDIKIVSTDRGFIITEISRGQEMQLNAANAIPLGAVTNKHTDNEPIVLIASQGKGPLYMSMVGISVDLTKITAEDIKTSHDNLKSISNLRIRVIGSYFVNGSVDFNQVVKLQVVKPEEYSKMKKLIAKIDEAIKQLEALSFKLPPKENIKYVKERMGAIKIKLEAAVKKIENTSTSPHKATSHVYSTLFYTTLADLGKIADTHLTVKHEAEEVQNLGKKLKLLILEEASTFQADSPEKNLEYTLTVAEPVAEPAKQQILNVITTAIRELDKLKNICTNDLNRLDISKAIIKLGECTTQINDARIEKTPFDNVKGSIQLTLHSIIAAHVTNPTQENYIIRWGERFLNFLAQFFLRGTYESNKTKQENVTKTLKDMLTYINPTSDENSPSSELHKLK